MPVVYRFDETQQVFVTVPGDFVQIAAGTGRDPWALDASNGVFHFNPDSGQFEQIFGILDVLRVGLSGDAWGLFQGAVLRHEGGFFRSVPVQLSAIAPAAAGFAWGLNAAGATFLLEGQNVQSKPGPSLAFISTGGEGNAWGLGFDGEVFSSTEDSVFHDMGVQMSALAVGVWMPSDNLLQNPNSALVWALRERIQDPPSVIREHDIFKFNPEIGFVQVNGELMSLAVGGEDAWGIDALHQPCRFENQARGFVPKSGPQMSALSVGRDGVWGLGFPSSTVN